MCEVCFSKREHHKRVNRERQLATQYGGLALLRYESGSHQFSIPARFTLTSQKF